MPVSDGGFGPEWECRDGRPLEDDCGNPVVEDPRLPPGTAPGSLRRSFIRDLLPKIQAEIDRLTGRLP